MSYQAKDVWSAKHAALDLPELSVIARSMIAARRALHGPLPSELIHDPALDLLLALFVASLSDQPLDRESLAGKTSVSESVATRWIDALAGHGLVDRDGADIALTEAGLATVVETLRAVAKSQWHLEDVR